MFDVALPEENYNNVRHLHEQNAAGGLGKSMFEYKDKSFFSFFRQFQGENLTEILMEDPQRLVWVKIDIEFKV